MYKNSSIFIWTGIMLFAFILSSCVNEDKFPAGTVIVCDAEHLNKKGDKFVSVNDSSVLFNAGSQQSANAAHSGKYSVRTIPKKLAFALGHKIQKVKPDSYFIVSVWRKSKDGKGVLVVAAKDLDLLYLASSKPIAKGDNGWEKIEFEVYTPPNFGIGLLSFYVWNNGSDTVYFDDLRIEHKEKKEYPKYEGEVLAIILDTSDYLKIVHKRKTAFENGILQSTDNDWVPGIIFSDDNAMKAKLRLKGDWLDHLHGDKWSYRIKMKKNYSWNKLRTFSIQTPLARNYLLEWLAHQFYLENDILTTRYGFIPVIFNSEARGIYAWEEHFVKQLLENKKRREGPIVKFTEESFWQVQMIYKETKKWVSLPFYQAAVIKPFGQSKTVSSDALFPQFLSAQKLMFQYKNQLSEISDIFDIDKLARYYAMLELTHARHGMTWHNQRMYYNPVLCKLEPITFDGYADLHAPDISIKDNMVYRALTQKDPYLIYENLVYRLFTDTSFLNIYFDYLEEYCQVEFVNRTLNSLQPKIDLYDSMLKLEFPYYHYNANFMHESAKKIRDYLPEVKRIAQNKLYGKEFTHAVKEETYSENKIFKNTPEYFVNAYQQKRENDSLLVKIFNFYPNEIIILGTGSKEKYIEYFEHPEPQLDSYQNEIQSLEIVSDTSSKFLFFMVNGHDATFKTEIYPWPSPQGETAQQELMAKINLENKEIFEKIEGKDIYIKQGDLQIDYPLIIPKDYIVHFIRGTTLDLVDGAMFISYSPIEMLGTESEPITITSSDFSANGFTVLQASEKSKLDYVVFENMNTLDYKGWTLTSSVTFYESDVSISNSTFYRNQCEDALNIIRSDFLVENAVFDNIYSDAFDSDFSTGQVIGSTFTNIGNDAIDFSGSEIVIRNTIIIKANDKGISGGEESHLIVSNVIIQKANIGIASKDLSVVEVVDSEISDCNYGLVLLQKKPEYGPASMIISNTKIIKPKVAFLIEKGSVIHMDGKLIKGSVKNVADLFY